MLKNFPNFFFFFMRWGNYSHQSGIRKRNYKIEMVNKEMKIII